MRGGDFENNDGSGGHSAYEERYMVAEQAPLPDTRGAVRMNGVERGVNGRCKVASQFMVWLEEDGYKHYQYTLVFGRSPFRYHEELRVVAGLGIAAAGLVFKWVRQSICQSQTSVMKHKL